MLAVIFCLVGVAALLGLADYLGKYKKLKGENQRKLTHICVAAFVAFWPWLTSWRAIQYIGLAMLAGVIINRSQKFKIFGFNKTIKRETYGDIFFALAIIACALLTKNKVFFALAMLNLSLADGLAAFIGLNFGKHWKYKVYHHTKTVIGSMAFWIASACILGTGLLFAHNSIDFSHYVFLVILLPPVLTVLENVSIMGLDDLVIPVAVVLVLRLAQMN
jgi:phytol kinase